MGPLVVVAAHADDETLMAGAALALWDGPRHIHVLCRGRKDHPDQHTYSQLEAAAAVYGATWSCAGHDDQTLDQVLQTTLIASIDEALDGPSVVITHTQCDVNADHRAVHDATLVAVRRLPCAVYGAAVPGSSYWYSSQWQPDTYLRFGEPTASAIMRAWDCYPGEHRTDFDPLSKPNLLRHWALSGSRIGAVYAQPFERIRGFTL